MIEKNALRMLLLHVILTAYDLNNIANKKNTINL